MLNPHSVCATSFPSLNIIIVPQAPQSAAIDGILGTATAARRMPGPAVCGYQYPPGSGLLSCVNSSFVPRLCASHTHKHLSGVFPVYLLRPWVNLYLYITSLIIQ